MCSIKDVYALLGISYQSINNWKYNPTSTQTINAVKYTLIEKASRLFSLNETETEMLANRAGLSMEGVRHNIDAVNTYFAKHFNYLLSSYSGKKIELYEAALVSDRMFRHIKSGKHLRKEPLLALLIVMELKIEAIQTALSKAGFILSSSLVSDSIIIWLLEK